MQRPETEDVLRNRHLHCQGQDARNDKKHHMQDRLGRPTARNNDDPCARPPTFGNGRRHAGAQRVGQPNKPQKL